MLCKHEVTGSIPVGSTSFLDQIGRLTEGEPSCPIDDRDKILTS